MLDIAAMKKLHKKVNLVPVIAKADSLTTGELSRFKAQILAELKQYDIQVFMRYCHRALVTKTGVIVFATRYISSPSATQKRMKPSKSKTPN